MDNLQHSLTILDQWNLHAKCYRRDGRLLWHLRGCWRPVAVVVKAIAAGILFLNLF